MLHTENRIMIAASPDVVYDLAADVARWPDLLSHYRYVRVIQQEHAADGGEIRRVVTMGALRDWIPVSWTSIQELQPQRRRVAYRHIGGVTTGMDVVWTIGPSEDGCDVLIEHDLVSPRWWLKRSLARRIVGDVFVKYIADKTLHGIKREAEAVASRSAR